MCGAYGMIGANENIPRAHLYVTVKKDAKESDIFDELRAAFNCQPNEYFELRHEPKTVKKFKFLTQTTSGGGIVAVEKESIPNPLYVPNDIENGATGTLGTLTMFCFKNDKHYALTCFHVGCTTDGQRCGQAFNAKELCEICESQTMEWYKEYAKSQLKYCYRHKQIIRRGENEHVPNSTELGKFYEGSFDSISDIMSIELLETSKLIAK